MERSRAEDWRAGAAQERTREAGKRTGAAEERSWEGRSFDFAGDYFTGDYCTSKPRCLLTAGAQRQGPRQAAGGARRVAALALRRDDGGPRRGRGLHRDGRANPNQEGGGGGVFEQST